MLKEDAVEKLVQKEVKRQVENQVAQAINDPEWVIELENKITKFVQDRIVARFSNISTVPDLVSTVSSSVEKMFEDGFLITEPKKKELIFDFFINYTLKFKFVKIFFNKKKS